MYDIFIVVGENHFIFFYSSMLITLINMLDFQDLTRIRLGRRGHDLEETFYRDSDGIAIQAVNSRALLYLTSTQAPRGWMLGAGTQFKADMVHLANSENRLGDVSQAFLMADSTFLDIGSLKVTDYATLIGFTGAFIAQAEIRTANFIRGSYTTNPANFIINKQMGLINFDHASGSEKGLSCVEDPENYGRCIL